MINVGINNCHRSASQNVAHIQQLSVKHQKLANGVVAIDYVSSAGNGHAERDRYKTEHDNTQQSGNAHEIGLHNAFSVRGCYYVELAR